MNVERRNPLARLSPRLMAIYLSLALIAIHLILLLGGLVRQNAANRAEQQLAALQSNVQELNASEQAELELLQASRDRWQERVDELDVQLPDPSQPFPVYERSQAIAEGDPAVLIRVERTGDSRIPTEAGSVLAETHQLTMESDLDTCLDFMAQLEMQGGAGLSLDEIALSPTNSTCTMMINTVTLAGDG